MKDKLKKIAILAGKLLISAAMLWFVFSKMDIRSIFNLIAGSNPWWLVGATFFFILSKLVSAFRLNLFFSAAGLQLAQITNLRLYLMGMFYNLFLPGGIGGDAYKVILLNRRNETKLKFLVQATILDRVTGLTALCIITLLLLVFLPLPRLMQIGSVAIIPVILLVSRLALKRFFPRFLGIFAISNLQSAGVQVMQLVSAMMILQALGFSGDFILLLAIFLVSSVMAVLPFTFGGAGAREFTFALAGTLFTLDQGTSETAIALGLLFYLITAITSLTGIWYLFFPFPTNGSDTLINDNEGIV
ncbi:MAG: lysylphosphatidylglycerol synthase transmembrane domain-containing protein [Bacteroidales bacterium]